MNDAHLRAWWSHRQGLDGALDDAAPAAVLEQAGWARSVGGASPYLALHARAGTSRAAADAAVRRLEIHELPAARGCTYVLPAADFALGLHVGQAFGDGEVRVASGFGVTEDEIARLCEAVHESLGAEPREPDAIRAAVGDAVRSFGPDGKKKGLTTTLPMALGRLQSQGRIRRVPVNGRLDQQRYGYVRWTPNPLDGDATNMAEAYARLARRFFQWVGPATLGELQWFTGLGVKAAKAAASSLGLVPAWAGSDRLLLPDDVDAFTTFEPPEGPRHVLVGSLDPLTATRRDVATLLDAADRDRVVIGDTRPLGGLADLPAHAIVDRGRIVGLWEFDTETRSIAWASWHQRRTATERSSLRAAIERTEAFVRDELGDARAFSLDSPKSRVPRLEAIRAMGA